MPLVVGIDEAGYGPTLGPLVVAGTYWLVRPENCGVDLWSKLGSVVAKRCDGGSTHLAVADSKEVFDRKRGIASLERTALAFLAAAGAAPSTLGALIDYLDPDHTGSALPWYRDLDRLLPIDPHRSAFAGISERLGEEMRKCGAECRCLRARVVPEDEFNSRLRSTRNKSSIVVEQVLALIFACERIAPGIDALICVDRLGGRANYRTLLQSAFPNRTLTELLVNETCSRYRLGSPRGDWEIQFTVEADRDHLPVALASMTAKYVREALMSEFNRFWKKLRPEIEPTAGYYTDARRFMREIEPVLPRAGLAWSAFRRER